MPCNNIMKLLITKHGKVIDHSGVTHNIAAKINGFKSLADFFNSGGVRIKQQSVLLCIESKKVLTQKQRDYINQLIRENQIFDIIADINGKTTTNYSFRRIKKL